MRTRFLSDECEGKCLSVRGFFFHRRDGVPFSVAKPQDYPTLTNNSGDAALRNEVEIEEELSKSDSVRKSRVRDAHADNSVVIKAMFE